MRTFKRVVTKQLGELLKERGFITNEQLEDALKVQKERGGLLGELLIELGFANEEHIAQALTAQYGFPFLPLKNYEIDKAVAHLIPEDLARQYSLIALDKIQDSLTIAISNPLKADAVQHIEQLTNCKVHVFVSTASDITAAINRLYSEEENA